ncbi:hypothetical protein ES703_117269 [subsurface metagenome]
MLFGAVVDDSAAYLSVGKPVAGGGRSVAQHLLGQDKAVDIRASLTPMLLGPGQANPALLGHPLGKLGVVAHYPGIATRFPQPLLYLALQKVSNLLPEFLLLLTQSKIHTRFSLPAVGLSLSC